MAKGDIRIVPTGGPLGVDAWGVDLERLSGEDFAVLHRAWLDHDGVLRVPGQFVPPETPDIMCLTVMARFELVTMPRSIPSFVFTPSVASSPASGPITSLSTLPTWISTLGSQSAHIGEFAIESSGGVIESSAHSNGPHVTKTEGPIGIGTWFAPISTACTENVTPAVITVLCMACQST